MGLSESKTDKEKEIEFLKQTSKVVSDSICTKEDKIDFSELASCPTDKVYVYCDLCYPGCNFVVAENFCTTCNRYLCKSCFVSHKLSVLVADTNHASRTTESIDVVRNRTQTVSLKQHIVEETHETRDVQLRGDVNVTNVEPKHVREINTAGCNDTDECWVSGIAVLKPGEIVVTDGNNCLVKIISVHNSDIITEIGLSSEPYDVTVVSKYEIGVTLPEEQRVQYLGTLNGLSKTRRMSVHGHCFGIAHINNMTAISFLCPEKVEIINAEGKILNRFEIDLRGKELFSAPCYVVFCPEGKSVYVSDHRKDSVMKFSLDGYHAATYRAGDLDRPEGLSVMKNGSVVVVSRDTNSIHVISPSCVRQRVLKGHNRRNGGSIVRPWSVCYCCEDNYLYVGNDEGQYVTVYELS